MPDLATRAGIRSLLESLTEEQRQNLEALEFHEWETCPDCGGNALTSPPCGSCMGRGEVPVLSPNGVEEMRGWDDDPLNQGGC